MTSRSLSPADPSSQRSCGASSHTTSPRKLPRVRAIKSPASVPRLPAAQLPPPKVGLPPAQLPVVQNPSPSARSRAVRSDGTQSNTRLSPAQPLSPRQPANSGGDVMQCISALRSALRQRVQQTAVGTTTTGAPLTREELSAAQGALADMAHPDLSAEELYALTGVDRSTLPTPHDAAALDSTRTPLGGEGVHQRVNPPTARRSIRLNQFSGITKVRHLLPPEKLVFGEADAFSVSGNYGAVMEDLEHALDSNEAAVARAKCTASRIQSLLDSWDYLRNGDYHTMADRVMKRMVKKAPSLSDTPITGTLHSEALALMGMVGRAVLTFASPEDTSEVTLEMGARHAMFSVTEAHYNALRDAFMEELPHYLPPALYESTLSLWQTMWRVIISLFLTSVTSDRGECYAKQKHERWVDLVQKTLGEVVKREMGGPSDERKHPFIMHMYDRGVAIDSTMKRYFLLREVRNCDRSMEAVIRIVTNLRDMTSVNPFLEELGFLHIEYGMTVNTLNTYRQPFLDTCAQYVGDDPEYWNPEAIKAVGQLWDYISAKWAVGFTVNKKSMTSANAPDAAAGFCLIFTDIEGSSMLWEKDRDVMCQAVKNHHRIVRALIADFDGYEVKTIGDSFMIACKDVLIAVKIAVGIQLEFMRTPTAPGFKMLKKTQGGGDPNCWRSDAVRVRVGMHWCENVDAVYDAVQRRYDYYGTDVNIAARTESAAAGGQILLTEKTYLALLANERFATEPRHRLLAGISTTLAKGSDEYMKPLSAYVQFADLGNREMKGIAGPVHLYSLVPIELAGRVFTPASEMSTVSATSSNALGLQEGGCRETDDEMTGIILVEPLGGDVGGSESESAFTFESPISLS